MKRITAFVLAVALLLPACSQQRRNPYPDSKFPHDDTHFSDCYGNWTLAIDDAFFTTGIDRTVDVYLSDTGLYAYIDSKTDMTLLTTVADTGYVVNFLDCPAFAEMSPAARQKVFDYCMINCNEVANVRKETVRVIDDYFYPEKGFYGGYCRTYAPACAPLSLAYTDTTLLVAVPDADLVRHIVAFSTDTGEVTGDLWSVFNCPRDEALDEMFARGHGVGSSDTERARAVELFTDDMVGVWYSRHTTMDDARLRITFPPGTYSDTERYTEVYLSDLADLFVSPLTPVVYEHGLLDSYYYKR